MYFQFRFVKNQQRSAVDRLPSSAANADSPLQTSPAYFGRDSKSEGRSDSTDSGLVSGGNKRPSMESVISNRLRSTASDGSSPG